MKEQKEYSNNNKRIVGADASVCPQKRNTQNGITLIALIITIIVLLILAMVSIKLVWDGGIITYAKTAVAKYKEAEKNEIDQINNIFGNNENQNNVPEDLEKYLLGKTLMDVFNEDGTFLDDPDSITDASTSVTFLNAIEDGIDMYLYLKYGNTGYKLVCDVESYENKSVSLVYTPSGKEGQTVEYSYDGTEANKKEWTILYDNGDNIEIVSPNVLGKLTLGEYDEKATGNNGFEKALNSYNNAIERINSYTSSLITNSNKISVRSVGSNPNNPNEDNMLMYTSEKLESWKCTYNEYKNGTTTQIPVTINGRAKRSDNNFEQDFVRMSYWNVAGSDDYYWFASRSVEESESEDFIYFRVFLGGRGDDELIACYKDKVEIPTTNGRTESVRPVVKIKS